MTPADLLSEAVRRGIRLEVHGEDVRYTAPKGALTPELRERLRAHKAALRQLLTPPAADLLTDKPCPACGGTAWRETPDGGRWCEPCVIAGRVPVTAVKIHSEILDAPLWVVADDVPREQRPHDGTPVYTHHEVQMLRQASTTVLQWVHAAKRELGGTVAETKAPHKGKDNHEAACPHRR
jgi:hypothetical protein